METVRSILRTDSLPPDANIYLHQVINEVLDDTLVDCQKASVDVALVLLIVPPVVGCEQAIRKALTYGIRHINASLLIGGSLNIRVGLVGEDVVVTMTGKSDLCRLRHNRQNQQGLEQARIALEHCGHTLLLEHAPDKSTTCILTLASNIGQHERIRIAGV